VRPDPDARSDAPSARWSAPSWRVDFEVLHRIVLGDAQPAWDLGSVTAPDDDEGAPALARLAQAELVRESPAGHWIATAGGRRAHRERLAEEYGGTIGLARMRRAQDVFEPLDRIVWALRASARPAGDAAPDDLPPHPMRIDAELEAIHVRALRLLDSVASSAPRLAAYGAELRTGLERARALLRAQRSAAALDAYGEVWDRLRAELRLVQELVVHVAGDPTDAA